MRPKFSIDTQFVRQIGPFTWLYRNIWRQLNKRIFKRDMYLRLPTGKRMLLPRNAPFASEVYLTHATIDWGADAWFAGFARKDRDFIDGGANIGYYSLYLSPLVRRVYSFEPDPRNFDALKKNIAQSDNITHVAKALSNQSCVVHFDVSNNSAIGGISDQGTLEVEALTLDAFVAANKDISVGLIKSDVEGHDMALLEGAAETIKRDQPLVFTEFLKNNEILGKKNDPEKLFEFCRRFNYQVYAHTYEAKRPRHFYMVPMQKEDLDRIPFKMLFLTPPHLQPQFIQACKKPSN